MTQQELDALKVLADEVRDGPFDAHETEDGWYVRSPGDFGDHLVACCDSDYRYDRQMAAYIAAACNAVPALVAEVERLTARVAELEIALEAEEFARERRMDNLDPD